MGVRGKARKEELLQELSQVGWQVVSGREVDRMRRNTRGRVLREVLAAQLSDLNPETVDRVQAEEWGREVDSYPGTFSGNFETWRLWQGLRGSAVSGGQARAPLRLLGPDLGSPSGLHVCSDFRYQGELGSVLPDLVFFVNGLPALVLQVGPGYGSDEVQFLQNELAAMRQWCPEFFAAVPMVGVVSGEQAFYGCAWTMERDGLYPWDENLCREGEGPFFLSPSRVSWFLRHAMLFLTDEGKLDKLVLRPHQLGAIQAIQDRVEEAGARRGLIQHAPGTGKSVCLLAAARAVSVSGVDGNLPLTLVLIDPNEGRGQLQALLKAWGWNRQRTLSTTQELDALLGEGSAGPWVSFISDYTDLNSAFSSAHAVVLMDGAWAGQVSGLESHLFQALPNATFICFAGGAPSAGAGSARWAEFALDDHPRGYLHRYSRSEAEASGFLRPVVYEAIPSAENGESTSPPSPGEKLENSIQSRVLERVARQLQSAEPRVLLLAQGANRAVSYRQVLGEQWGEEMLIDPERYARTAAAGAVPPGGVLVLPHFPPRAVAGWTPGCLVVEGELEEEALTYLRGRVNRPAENAAGWLLQIGGKGGNEIPRGFWSREEADAEVEERAERAYSFLPSSLEAESEDLWDMAVFFRLSSRRRAFLQAFERFWRWYEAWWAAEPMEKRQSTVKRLVQAARLLSWAYPESGQFPASPGLQTWLDDWELPGEVGWPGLACLCAGEPAPPRGRWCREEGWRFFCRRSIIVRSRLQGNARENPYLSALWPELQEIFDHQENGMLDPGEAGRLLDPWVAELQRARREWRYSDMSPWVFAWAWRMGGRRYRRHLRTARRLADCWARHPRWPTNGRELQLLRQGVQQALMGGGRTQNLVRETDIVLEIGASVDGGAAGQGLSVVPRIPAPYR